MGNDRRRIVRDFYDAFAESYDENRYGTVDQKFIDRITKTAYLELMGEVVGKRILDCGCGTGRFSVLLKQMGARVISMDVSENMLKKLKQKTKEDGVFVRGDVFSLPFSNKSFDIIVCSQVLTHLHKYKEPLMEFARVLNKGGKILIDIRNLLHPRCLYRSVLQDVIVGVIGQLRYLPHYTHIFKIKGICNSIYLKVTEYRGIQTSRSLSDRIFSRVLIVRIEKRW